MDLQAFKRWLSNDTSKYLISITLGVVFGIVLNVSNAGNVVSSILTLPGPLFLRSLQCAVIPMMFFNIIVSIADIYREGAAGTLGKKVLHFYFLTTLLAVTNGCIVATAFSSLLSSNTDDDDDGGVDIELLCPKSFADNVTSYEKFSLIDSEDALLNDATPDRTFLDQILSTFDSLVPNNVIQSFAVANIISIIVIGLVFGVAMTHISSAHEDYRNSVPVVTKPSGGGAQGEESFRSNGDVPSGLLEDSGNGFSGGSRTANPKIFTPGAVFDFCREMSLICNLIIQWIIKLAPYCIAFLIAGSLSQAGNLIYLLKSVGIYCVSSFVGICIHLSISLPLVFFYYTGENPYAWMFSCRRAMLVALSTASSAATLPISIECVVEGGISPALANVVLPMGANVNMDGSAISFPCAILFLASSINTLDTLSPFTWINIALCSSLGSVGAAPVPSAGMVTLITVWQTVFPSDDVPEAIAYVQAIDFLVDRLNTMTNVASDVMIIRMLQAQLSRERASFSSSGNQRESIIEVATVKNAVREQSPY